MALKYSVLELVYSPKLNFLTETSTIIAYKIDALYLKHISVAHAILLYFSF